MFFLALYRGLTLNGIKEVSECTSKFHGKYLQSGNYRGLFRPYTQGELEKFGLSAGEIKEKECSCPGELVDGNHKAFVLDK